MSHYPRTYHPQALANADELFQYFLQGLDWQSYPIRMFGRELTQPRLVSFYADEGLHYHYSQTQLIGTGRDQQLLKLCQQLNTDHHLTLNSVLCNLYRDGNDSMGRHSDDEPELGADPVIASITLGSSRVFKMRHKITKETISITLEHGSLLLMGSNSQTQREHCLPKTSRTISPRINCTFRTIVGK